VLAVVEDEEEPEGAEERGQHLRQRAPGAFADAERPADRRQDERRVAHRRQIDDAHPVGVAPGLGRRGCRAQRELSLANPAGTGERQQRDIVTQQQIPYRGQLAVAPDQRSPRSW
jgi:hypothetical protein